MSKWVHFITNRKHVNWSLPFSILTNQDARNTFAECLFRFLVTNLFRTRRVTHAITCPENNIKSAMNTNYIVPYHLANHEETNLKATSILDISRQIIVVVVVQMWNNSRLYVQPYTFTVMTDIYQVNHVYWINKWSPLYSFVWCVLLNTFILHKGIISESIWNN